MANYGSFSFTVDTDPMANTLSQVTGHVRQTTAAVVAMEQAVIESEKVAADNICKNVSTGFHILIQSQVSQKAAGYFSQMSSKMILLAEFAKSLSQTQTRMNNDYQRLKREYGTIFHGLDKALENRIRALDKYAMQLGDFKKNLTRRYVKDAPAALFYSRDTQNVNQMMFAARIKSKAGRAIDNMTQNVYGTQFYAKQLDSVLKPSNVTENTNASIPVVCTEEKSPVSADSVVNNIFVSDGIGNIPKTLITNTVMLNMDKVIDAPSSGAEQSEIKNEFMKLVSNSGLDERVTNQIVTLFNGGN